MVASLTGFGRAETSYLQSRVAVEIKSFNNRFLQIDIHLPYGYSWLDAYIRPIISEKIKRGKVFVSVEILDFSQSQNIIVNKQVILQLLQLKKEFEKEVGQSMSINLDGLLALPGIVKTETNPDTKSIWEQVEPVLQNALKALLDFRLREGTRLAEDMKNRQQKLVAILNSVKERLPIYRREFEERFRNRLVELAHTAEIDETRLVTEIAIWADRSDISEELTRLSCHLDELGRVLNLQEAIGKRLDFLLQEIHREANTINNKVTDLSITQHILEMKCEVEKIREQIQNVE